MPYTPEQEQAIKKYKDEYAQARSAGNAGAMQKANEGANAIRAQAGEKAEVANVDIANVRANTATSNLDTDARAMSDAYAKNQKAQLDANYANQVADLEKALADAVAQGKISVRDAEEQFTTQKAQIEQQAYLASEQTALYGQDMGIQNSQQQVGLMQGDQARTQSLINQNISTRDKRINDIKDRMDAVKNQFNIDKNRLKENYRAGVLGANSQADLMYSQNMFDVKRDDYTANRNQQYAIDNINLQNKLQLGQMKEASNLRIQEMGVANDFDMKKMEQSLKDQMQLNAQQFGFSSRLQSQSAQNQMNELIARANLEIQQEERQYKLARDRELAKYDPKTPEYAIRKGQLEDAYKQKIADIHAGTVYEFTAQQVLQNPALANPVEKPTSKANYDASTGIFDPLGYLYDKFSGYDKKKSAYDAYMEAVQRKNDFLKSNTGLLE